MKLSDLLEITNNYKNIKDLQPLNESYAAEPLRRWHTLLFQQHLLHDFVVPKKLKYNPAKLVKCYNIKNSAFKDNMKHIFTSIVSKYPSSLSMHEFLTKVMEENFHPKRIYDVMRDQYYGFEDSNSAKQFIDNINLCVTNIYNIWDNIKLGDDNTFPDFTSFKIANVKPDEFYEIPLADIRLRKHSNDLIFFENDNDELAAISLGVKLICVFQHMVPNIPVINVNSDKFDWEDVLSISDQQFIDAYHNFQNKFYYSMADDLTTYLCDKIFESYEGLTKCYDVIFYSNDHTLYTRDMITRKLSKLTTKVLFEEKGILTCGNITKAYVIPESIVKKNTNLASYNARWSYNYYYANKYNTDNELLLDLALMKEHFNKLKETLRQSKEFLGLTNKVSELYDILDKKQHMLYKIYYEALKNDRKSKASRLNRHFIPEIMADVDDETKNTKTLVSFLGGISKEIIEQLYNLINILNELKDFSAMDIAKLSLKKPADFDKLQSNIKSSISSYNLFFKSINDRRSKTELVKDLINEFSDIFPELIDIFDFSNVELKN